MAPLVIRINGPIMGTQRTDSSGKQRFTSERTRNAYGFIAWSAIQQVGRPVLTGALRVGFAVVVEIPASWSGAKKRRALAGEVRPTVKPDFDNVSKMLTDPLNLIVWKDDAQIVESTFSKRYGEMPGAVITVEAL